jgi:hypothetical protein
MIQVLVFNSTEKTVNLLSGTDGFNLYSFENVPTVKVENGYYEVMQKSGENGGVVPVLRVPIANTNMLIQK